MSTYGNEPPQDPYGQQPPSNPYGAPPPPPPPPPANPYGGQPGYGQPGQAGYGQAYASAQPYAGWLARVLATLIDGFAMILAGIPLFVGYGLLIAGLDTTTNPDGTVTASGSVSSVAVILIIVGFILYLGFAIWNTIFKAGRTGYSIGKGVMGIKLIGEATGQPIGAGLAFVRQIAHILDGFCYVGYLWPLWDAKKQTFADKIMSSVVIIAPKS